MIRARPAGPGCGLPAGVASMIQDPTSSGQASCQIHVKTGALDGRRRCGHGKPSRHCPHGPSRRASRAASRAASRGSDHRGRSSEGPITPRSQTSRRPRSRHAAGLAKGRSHGDHKRRRAARRRSHSRGATHDELATLAGVSRQTVVKIEGGLEPRPPTIRKLAKALGGEPKNLMAPEEPQA